MKTRAGRWLGFLFILMLCYPWGLAEGRSGTSVELLSGFGYQNATEGLTLLLGFEIGTYKREGNLFTGIEERKIGLHVSDVFTIGPKENTFSAGIDGQWTRTRGPFSFSLGGQAFYRWQEDRSARTFGISGTGASGRLHGRFRADYVESSLGTFPWFQKDLEGMSEATEDGPFYRAQIGVTASVVPKYRLNWTQEVKWRRPVRDQAGVFTVMTGPQFDIGGGTLGAQGGLLFHEHGMKPVGQIRYEHRPFQSNIDFQFTMATRSLDGDHPVIYGWLGVTGKSLDFGAAVHFEENNHGVLNPAVYFSIHPKF